MTNHPLTPEQSVQISGLQAEFAKELERVGVDMAAAVSRISTAEPPIERRISEHEFEVTHSFGVNMSAIVETLRGLPDGAGTEAFVAAYKACR